MLVHIPLSLFFFTTSETKTNTSAGHAIPFSTHQHFNVKESVSQAIKLHPLPKTQEEFIDESRHKGKEGSWKLKLLHRDKLPFSHITDFSRQFGSRMKRDAHRVAALIRRTRSGDSGKTAEYEVEEFGAEVVSCMDQGSGEYFVRIGVGSPAKNQ
ncbi:PREDICTED: protein ASPARTIC PROTEASE IN GUARD CELL 2-like [Ipomoea nil]|uniref:protein ASPARTIC PROTEASE IN GUARD CELL 2-like n=1 Tax=Ipomoea nil TaxID=35883 RepID=UPI0009016A06|nr:PREDICTED: protein ASPARTIC PROTEASE IN GUARD CELL 2-like [Ipomoea nil]XP_019191489.1 PREDICTED: protein ASPARTIC PROTEASE IN GUARD CELL 2-like [Ipomoea nil]XP_019191490.1 PREDICTED: protein ASPARTIC PROTEASE IN GUARD CELL 2-like [Ipomoea nil]